MNRKVVRKDGSKNRIYKAEVKELQTQILVFIRKKIYTRADKRDLIRFKLLLLQRRQIAKISFTDQTLQASFVNKRNVGNRAKVARYS